MPPGGRTPEGCTRPTKQPHANSIGILLPLREKESDFCEHARKILKKLNQPGFPQQLPVERTDNRIPLALVVCRI